MGIILIGIGVPFLLLLATCIARGEWPSALVIVAACCAFLGLWKRKSILGPEAWEQSRIVIPKMLKIGLGTCLIAFSLFWVGFDLRTIWEENLGHFIPDPEQPGPASDFLVAILICGVGLALIGFEKFAGSLMAVSWFAFVLAGAFLSGSDHPTPTIAFTYAVAFLIIFLAGWLFRWSKGFYLSGLVAMLCFGLKVYLTM